MKMRYITRDNGPAAFGTKIGIEGVTHVYDQGSHIADTIFQVFVDNGTGGDIEKWHVGAVFRARTLEGELSGGGTVVSFGDMSKLPFHSFEDALAFCGALGRDMYDRRITVAYMDDIILRRGMQAMQWIDAEVAQAADPDPEDEVEESDGGNCDVRVEVPAGRTLH